MFDYNWSKPRFVFLKFVITALEFLLVMETLGVVVSNHGFDKTDIVVCPLISLVRFISHHCHNVPNLMAGGKYTSTDLILSLSHFLKLCFLFLR